MMVAAVCLAAFAALTVDVVCHGAVKRVDEPLGLWLHANVPAWAMLPGATISGLGNAGVAAVVVLATAALVVNRRRWKVLALGAAALAVELVLINVLKPWLALERPDARFTNWVFNYGYTYPSGHTTGAVVVYGILALALTEIWPTRRRLWWAGAILIWAGVGVALVLVGVHYVTDVLAGWALGGAIVAGMLAIAARKKARGVEAAGLS